MPNIYHFSDLSKPMQEQLLQYIASHFSKRRAYNKEEHDTCKCVSESMEACGY